MIQCQGGWCQQRSRCMHYLADATPGIQPADRLCGKHEEPALMHDEIEKITHADIHPGAARALADLHDRLRTRALEMLADPSTDKESLEWAKKWVTTKPASGTLGATENNQ